MDPAADIVSTAVLFGAFWIHGLVPGWVFAILMCRYGSLFAGCLLLPVLAGPIRYRATPVGKIVGVLQGAAGIIILVLAQSGVQWQDTIGVALFPLLGMIFGSVIVSQVTIGIRHLKRYRGGGAARA